MRITPRAGIREVGNSSNIQIAPNPSKGVFSVKGNIGSDAQLKVIDMTGRIVYTQAITASNGYVDATIQLPGVSQGLYLLSLTSDTENIVSQIVVE